MQIILITNEKLQQEMPIKRATKYSALCCWAAKNTQKKRETTTMATTITTAAATHS